MTCHQLTSVEGYMLAALRRQGLNQSEIARTLGRHRSTVCREVSRSSTRADGRYRAFTAKRGRTDAAPARAVTNASRSAVLQRYFGRNMQRVKRFIQYNLSCRMEIFATLPS